MALETYHKEVPDVVYKNEEGEILEVYQDLQPENPRDFGDYLGTIVCWHKRYNLGDEQPQMSPEDYLETHKEDLAVILPVYLYDHSGLTISTKPFSCPWDSGQVGYIVAFKSDVENNLSEDDVKAILQAEIEEYNNYLIGNVWRFEHKSSDGELIDSCSGFVGDIKYSGLLDHVSGNWEVKDD